MSETSCHGVLTTRPMIQQAIFALVSDAPNVDIAGGRLSNKTNTDINYIVFLIS
jgi:hypothetical protein